MFKSNIEVLSPLNNPILQDPDGAGVTGLTRGNRIFLKGVPNEFKRTPFSMKKPLAISEIRVLGKRATLIRRNWAGWRGGLRTTIVSIKWGVVTVERKIIMKMGRAGIIIQVWMESCHLEILWMRFPEEGGVRRESLCCGIHQRGCSAFGGRGGWRAFYFITRMHA